MENIIIEIKEHTVHLRLQVLNFNSFNHIFDRHACVIYSYMNSLILGENRLPSISNKLLKCCSKVTVSFRPLLGKQCLL